MLVTALVYLLLVATMRGQQIQQCGSGYVEVVENTASFSLTCTGHGSSVTWEYGSGTSDVDIGTCTSSSCQLEEDYLSAFFMLTSLSSTSSRLNFTRDAIIRTLGGYTYRCGVTACIVHIVVPAQLATPTITVTTPPSGSGWTVSGTVDITTVYSSRGQYGCQWTQTRGNGAPTQIVSKNASLDPANMATDNRTGRCDFTNTQLPSDPGTYTYTVIVSPGPTEITAVRDVVIASPSPPTLSCTDNNGYVSEGGQVRCTCNGSVGRPQGRLRWTLQGNNNVDLSGQDGDYGDGTVTMTMTVSRSHNGSRLRCDVDWITDVTGQSYVINVAYGPANVTIPGTRTFDTNSTGSVPLTLTCDPGTVNPTDDLTYSWTGRCQGNTGSTCTFSPHPPGDDGLSVRCTVRNPYSSIERQSDPFLLDLNYPPPGAPVITRSPSSPNLYEGDDLSLTCEVTGGKPLVTSVSFACGSRHPDNSDVTGSDSVISSVQMRLMAEDDSITCTCTAQWKVTSYYTLTRSTSLTVFYRPDPPEIQRTDTRPFPYLEGDTANLSCDIQGSRGNPTASLTWSGHGNGQTTNPGGAPATLVLPSVDRGDNNRNITCTAMNNFTQVKGQTVQDSWILQVYYPPSISLSGTSDTNQCQLSPDQTQCTVTEGQRVYITSTAHSNPDPVTFLWTKQHNTGLDPGTASILDLPNTSHVTHNGIYTLTVTTGNLANNRGQWRNTQNLTVLVLYSPDTVSLSINSQPSVLTLNESDPVTFTCQTDGRPSPGLRLENRVSGDVITSVGEGVPVVEDVVTWLNHSTAAACQHTGNFTCRVVGGGSTTLADDVSLFVNCSPRLEEAQLETPSVNYISRPVTVTFDLVAYPTPDTFSYVYHGPEGNVSSERTAVQDTGRFDTHCWTTTALYAVSCNVTTNTIMSDSETGVYSVAIGNDFGQEEVRFIVKLNASEEGPAEPVDGSINGAAIGAGIGSAVVVIAIVALVVFFIRRRGSRKPTKRHQNGRQQDAEEPEMIVNSLYGTSGSGGPEDDDGTMIVNTMYESSGAVGGQMNPAPQGSAYEDVELQGSKPDIKPKLQTPAPSPGTSTTGDEYATVVKGNKPQAVANAAPSDEPAEYATVLKDRKKTPASPPATASTSSGAVPKPDVKPKPNKKAKQEKPKGKKTGKKQDGGKSSDVPGSSADVYGNTVALSMSPKPPEGSVYENYGFSDEDGAAAASGQAPGAEGDSHTVNPDGLVYTTIAFSEEQRKKAEKPPPDRETTDYADLDFVELLKKGKK